AGEHVGSSEAGDPGTYDRYPHNRSSSGCEDWFGMSEAVAAQADVGTVRTGTSRISQVVTLVAVVVPPLGLVAAMRLLWNVAFHASDRPLMAGRYVVCPFATTIGFHRYFTHKSFEARTPVKATLAILGCMTMQGPLTQWVTDHRKHHALSDQDGDPH